jgi:hypothetical protein
MNENDPRFENYLREFEPRRPRAISSGPASDLQWRRLAAAAALTISLGSLAWFALHNKRKVTAPQYTKQLTQRDDDWRKVSLIQWTRLAEEDSRALDAELSEVSRKSLPSFDQANSSLRALAKP